MLAERELRALLAAADGDVAAAICAISGLAALEAGDAEALSQALIGIGQLQNLQLYGLGWDAGVSKLDAVLREDHQRWGKLGGDKKRKVTPTIEEEMPSYFARQPKHGAISQTARHFNVSRATVRKVLQKLAIQMQKSGIS